MFRKTALGLSSMLMAAGLCFARATGREYDRYQEHADQVSPSDLTQLAKKNDGKYPSNQVAAVLKFGSGAGPHGSKDMPVRGPCFSLSTNTMTGSCSNALPTSLVISKPGKPSNS